MPRKNTRAKKPRQKRSFGAVTVSTRPKGRKQYGGTVEQMVVPQGRCGARPGRKGKLIYTTEADAAKALRQAQSRRDVEGQKYVEERFYECPRGGTKHWHLTSLTEFKPKGDA